MPTQRKGCSTPGCVEVGDSAGRCPRHRSSAERVRGSAQARGYGSDHETLFRRPVLLRTPWCVCGQRASHADHYPKTRRQLVREGLDPNDPKYGRGLCQSCHMQWTAEDSPGGAVAAQG